MVNYTRISVIVVATGMTNIEPHTGRLRERMSEGMTQCFYSAKNMTEMPKATNEKDAWRNMLVNVARLGLT